MLVSGSHFLDIVITLLLALGTIIGFFKGVIKQAFSLAGLLGGLICGSLLYRPLGVFLQTVVNIGYTAAEIIAFILILIIVPLSFMVIGTLLAKLVEMAQLGFINRIVGAVFGMVKYLIIIGLFIQLLEFTNIAAGISESKNGKKSELYEPVRKITNSCMRWVWKKVLPANSIKIDKASDIFKEI
ncbi:MAG TPA: CvpA family protein [Bacteroidaceae bacterium]|nr:CvpA family protein [Bacteroidaceae bacterium]